MFLSRNKASQMSKAKKIKLKVQRKTHAIIFMFLYLVGQSDEFYAKQTGQERGTWSESVSFHLFIFFVIFFSKHSIIRVANKKKYINFQTQTQTQLRTHSLLLNSRQLKEKRAIKRLGTPQDIANLVAFLVSDASQFITGAARFLPSFPPLHHLSPSSHFFPFTVIGYEKQHLRHVCR